MTVAARVRLLAFAPFDWIDIVDAAPIPLAFDLRATRHRQIIEQVRPRVANFGERRVIAAPS